MTEQCSGMNIIKCGGHIGDLDAGLLPISQYSEGPATGHLDTDNKG